MSLNILLITVSLIALQIENENNLLGTRNVWKESYDYIVVGAGTAGAVVAKRLSEISKINVLLLEAGRTQGVMNDVPAIWTEYTGSEFDWNYTTVRQNNYGLATNGIIAQPRGKVLGGTSNINALVYTRGNERDFDNWVTSFGAKGWSFDEVLPYFIKFENNSDLKIVRENPGYHGTEGPVAISSDPKPQPILLVHRKAMNEFGFETIDINGPKQLGTAFLQHFVNKDTGRRSSSASGYLAPNPRPNNLHILTNAFVIKILFDKTEEYPKAIGVQFIKNNQLYEVRAKKEIIISAGI